MMASLIYFLFSQKIINKRSFPLRRKRSPISDPIGFVHENCISRARLITNERSIARTRILGIIIPSDTYALILTVLEISCLPSEITQLQVQRGGIPARICMPIVMSRNCALVAISSRSRQKRATGREREGN